MTFDDYLQNCPIVAILRGLHPDQAIEIGTVLFDAGIRIIEVPLNSPDPLESIKRLSDTFGDRALIGAGTVLTREDVRAVHAAGGKLIVSPNTDADVIAETVEVGLVSCPGVYTPTEAFAALKAGATALKVFPADTLGPGYIRAIRAVLPADTPILAVGGVTPANAREWLDAGCAGLGVGSNLFAPGITPDEVHERAVRYVQEIANG